MNKQIEASPEKNWTHRSDNRQRLIDAGYTVLSDKGIEATTVKEIARIAAVSPGLFHYYFSSKGQEPNRVNATGLREQVLLD